MTEARLVQEPSLWEKYCLILHLAGGYFFGDKKFRTAILNTQCNYPDFLSTTFDGRFFGLISSEIDRTISSAFEMGCTDHFHYYSHRGPLHNGQKLNSIGEHYGLKDLEKNETLERLGIHGKLSELSADLLSFNTLPFWFSTAYSLYLSLKKEKDIHKEMTDSFPPANVVIYEWIDPTTFKRLNDYYQKYRNGIVRVGDTRRPNPSRVDIPHEINRAAIREYYDYLMPKESNIKSWLEYFQNPKDKHSENQFLLEIAKKIANRHKSDISQSFPENIEKLISNFPEMPEIFVEKTISRLNTLRENLYDIQNSGYEPTFTVLEKLAESSSMEGKTPEEQLVSAVKIHPNCMDFRIWAPENIRESVRKDLLDKVWHYGMDLHVDDLSQFANTSHLLYKGAIPPDQSDKNLKSKL